MAKAFCAQCEWSISADLENCIEAVYSHLNERRKYCYLAFIMTESGKLYKVVRRDDEIILMMAKITYTVRDEVFKFAHAMEEKLRLNDHKEHWRRYSAFYLLDGLKGELAELESELEKFKDGGENAKDVVGEVVDVANYALMIWDVMRRYVKT